MNTSPDAIRPPSLAVAYCPVDTLRPDPRNARTHPKQQVDAWRAQAIADQIRNGLSVKEAGSNEKFKQASHVSQFVKRVLKNSPRDFRGKAVRFP